jgi:putative membrane protein insertion efficiency factor
MKNPLTTIAQLLIKVYQATLSPDHSWLRQMFPGGFCKYRPTCSQYMSLALEKHGFFKGLALGSYRILRCNPFSKGGLDIP